MHGKGTVQGVAKPCNSVCLGQSLLGRPKLACFKTKWHEQIFACLLFAHPWAFRALHITNVTHTVYQGFVSVLRVTVLQTSVPM